MFRDIRYLLTFQAILEADMWYVQGHSYMLRCAHSRPSVCAHTLWVLFRTDYCLVVTLVDEINTYLLTYLLTYPESPKVTLLYMDILGLSCFKVKCMCM